METMQVDTAEMANYNAGMKKAKEERPAAWQQVLTPNQVAEMKGVTVDTVIRAIKLPVTKEREGHQLKGEKVGRVYLIDRRDAEAWEPPRPRKSKSPNG